MSDHNSRAVYVPPLPGDPRLAGAFLKMRKFFTGKLFMWLCFLAGAIFISLSAEVAGAIVFALLIAFVLVVCDDIIATTFPFLVICISVLQCYDSFSTFIGFWWLAIPVVAGVVFHFVYYRRPIVIDKTFYGIAAVTVAVTIGGVGFIGITDYLRSAYYVIGLGAGMMLVYILIKSQLEIDRDYDLKERFADIMYMAGLFTCFRMIEIYAENYINLADEYTFSEFFALRSKIGDRVLGEVPIPSTVPNVSMLQPGNNISTFIMLFMPFPFYRAMNGKRHMCHLLSAGLMMGVILLSDSRGGIVFGSFEFLICLSVYVIFAKGRVSKIVGGVLLTVAVALIAIVIFRDGFFDKIKELLNGFRSEERGQLINLSLQEFGESPLVGKGLGNPRVAEIYHGKAGTMQWYHMMIPQIIGSMGCLGIATYAFQGIQHIFIGISALRGKAKGERGVVVTLLLSYLGVLMMSQVNPGLFCPLPYGLIAMALFAAIDGEKGLEPIYKLLRKNKE
jgi:hypothetical protein